jgi:hypothetical protein
MVLQGGRLLPSLFLSVLATPLIITRRGIVQVRVQLTAVPFGQRDTRGLVSRQQPSAMETRLRAGGSTRTREYA